MGNYVYEAHRYADEGAQRRAREEAYGRLRLALFWAFLGTTAITVAITTHYAPPKWLAWVIFGTVPVAISVFAVNYWRLPTTSKGELSALVMGFITLSFAAATTVLAQMFSLLTPGSSP
jgi:hypothetical protein